MRARIAVEDQVNRNGIRLRIAYDGTRFSGFARQPNARTVQGDLEHAIAKMTGTPTDSRGASRTDAGVHAYDQVVAFDTDKTIPLRGWVLGLNHHLDADISVRTAESVAAGYKPRFDSLEKTYRYMLQLGLIRDPLLRSRAWYLGPARSRVVKAPEQEVATATSLDVGAMCAAANVFRGTHSFHVFRSADDARPNATRTIHAIDIRQEQSGPTELIVIDVRGTAFMKNMVRIMVGTLLDVGLKKRSPESIGELFGPDARRDQAGMTAPAHGLCLMSIKLGRNEISAIGEQQQPGSQSE